MQVDLSTFPGIVWRPDEGEATVMTTSVARRLAPRAKREAVEVN